MDFSIHQGLNYLRRGINLPCNGFPYSKIPFSDQTRLRVINSQSKSHSNEHKMGVIEQKDQKKLRNSDKNPENRGFKRRNYSGLNSRIVRTFREFVPE